MRKFLTRLMITAMILVLVGGAVSAAGTQEKKTEKTGFKVVLLDASNDNTWRIQMEDQMQKIADRSNENGWISSYIVYSANNDANLQSQQLSQIVNQGADIVIINPVSASSLNPVIDKATARGVRVFAVDSTIDHPDVITFTNDQANWARIHVEWLVNELDGKGNIFWFNAIPGVPANDERVAVYEEVLAKYPKINVLARETHHWSVAEAKQKTSQLLAAYSQDIDGVLTQECSAGIIQAFVEAGRDFPDAINSGESIEDLRFWGKYGFNSLMVENPPAVGAHGLMIAVRLLQGRELKSDVISNNIVKVKQNLVIDNSMLDQWLEKTKDMKDTQYIDSLMTEEQIEAMFK
jgi:ribose transport system substrate-binding protein